MSSNIDELQSERDYLIKRIADAREDIQLAERQWGIKHYLTEAEIKVYKDLVERIRQNANAILVTHSGTENSATEIFGDSDIEKPI